MTTPESRIKASLASVSGSCGSIQQERERVVVRVVVPVVVIVGERRRREV